VLVCLIVAAALRLSYLDSEQLWVDEAESSINALTILERGYPADRYLGLPIYENVLLTTSPDSEEYEFKDSSYSDRGMAIYHGWLPLYSMAAAFAIAGIQPDVDDGRPPAARHTSRELTRRTVVPRIPSVIFAVAFLCGMYLLGRTISGAVVAWTVLTAAAFARPMVWFGWQARYYSATLALTVLSGLAIWTFTRRGTWRDAVVTGFALVLLFHTHSLSFLILTGVLLVNVPFGLRRPQWVSKLLLTGVIVACGIVPWMYWTNYFHAATRIPMAWPLLAFPRDFISWFGARKAFVAVIGLIVALSVASAAFPRHRFARRIMAAATDRPAFYFTLTWCVIAYVAFIVLIPAASFVSGRLMLVLAVPGYLLFALCIAVAGRAMTPRFAVLVSPLIVLVFLAARGTAILQAPHRMAKPVEALVEISSRWTLDAGTKLYAWPNQNLVLTYYTGLPVQSIAPVRKTFLDEYPGDVILFETGTPYADPPSTEARTYTRLRNRRLSAEDERRAVLRIQRYGARQYLQGRVADIWPPSEPTEEIDQALLAEYEEYTQRAGRKNAEEFLLLRGFAPKLMLTNEWLPAFYWYVNPERRLGDQLNYRNRVRGATGIILPNGSIIFDARRHRDAPLVDRAQYLALLRVTNIPGRDSTDVYEREGHSD